MSVAESKMAKPFGLHRPRRAAVVAAAVGPSVGGRIDAVLARLARWAERQPGRHRLGAWWILR